MITRVPTNHSHAGGKKIKPLVRNISLALTLGAGSMLHSGMVYAADAAPASGVQTEGNSSSGKSSKKPEAQSQNEGVALPSVTVTAQKREENVQKVATAISALGGKELQDKGIGRSAYEVLEQVPNASAATQGHTRPRWWIRGVGAGQQQWDLANPVGFYLDEVYISNATATGFPLFDLERVEVLRGPQGTLWGKNTTGGAISVVSKKPSFNESAKDNFVKVDYGSFNDQIIQGGVGGVIADEKLAGRISFSRETKDGHFDNEFTGGKDGGLSDGAIRGQLLAIFTPNLEAQFNVHSRKYTSDGAVTTTASYAPTGILRNGYIPSTNPANVSTNAPNSDDASQNGASINLKWQLGRFALNSITGYEDLQRETLGDGDNTPLEISRGHTFGKSKQISQEFRLTSPREDRLNWVSGLHYFKEEINYSSQSAQLPVGSVPAQAAVPAQTAATFNTSTLDHKDTSFAVFGSTSYSFSDQLAATLGLRWTRETKDYSLNRLGSTGLGTWGSLGQWWNSYTGAYQAAGTLASGTFSTAGTQTWSNFTYDFTPEYKITEHARVYFKYAHGLKSGGFNSAATNLAAVNTVNPEILDSYEVGYKSEWLNDRLNFNASAFHYNYKDVQVNVVGFNALAGTTVSYLQNAAKATVNGAEFEIEALPTDRLHVNASLGLLRAKFDQFDILNNGGSLAGNELVRSPHVTAQVAGDYRIPLENGSRVVVGADARYLSKQYYYVTPQSAARDILNQDPYTIVNARLAYSTPGEAYTWTAYVNNLANTRYKNHALPAFQAGVVNGDSVYNSAPRTVGVSLTTRW